MAAQREGRRACLKAVAAVGLLAAALTLLASVTKPEAFRKISSGNKGNILRNRRAVEDECVGAFSAKDSGSTLTSPNYPDSYPSNAHCHWLIVADDPNSTVILKITTLSIEPERDCRLDYLQVYLGPTPLSPALGPFCGNIHNKVIETNVSRVLVEFFSDLIYEDKGFSIEYFTQTAGDCQESRTEGSGTIRSPGFPDNYPDNTDCTTLITVAEDKKVLLIFDSVDLELGDNCTFDYIQIFDGRTKDSTLLGQICKQTDVRSFESSSSSLLVHFHSDDSVNKRGFRARYSSVDKRSSAIGDCVWETGERNGTISSPNYPENYPSFANCSVWVLAPEGSTVSITIDAVLLEMDANCSFDFLLITERSGSDSKTLGRFCGMRWEPKELISTHHEVRIQFQSDDFVEFSGFKLRYHYVQEEKVPSEKFVENDDVFDGTLAFSATPANVTLSEGSSSVLHCSTKHPTAKIRWLKGDLFLAGSSPLPGLKFLANNSLWIQAMNRGLVGKYTCVAISPEDEVAATAYVFMTEETDNIPCDVEFRKTPSDSEFEEDAFAHLECLSAGDRAVLSWEKDGAPLEMQGHITVVANGYIFMERIRLQDAGLYTCLARDAVSGCTKRASALLKVIEKVKIEDICGRSRVAQSQKKKSQNEHGKIIGGYDARKGAYPWQVMLWEPTYKSFCGATLLNERWLATAAHCFINERNIQWDNVKIFLGKHDREREEEDQLATGIAGPSSIVVHPGFKAFTFDNDLALVRMRDHVRFTDHILPVCLGDRNISESLLHGDPNRPRMGTVIGWGRLKENGASPRFLQEIKLPIVDQELCKASTDLTVTRNMFCAGYSQEVIGDACNGDSGGPFLMFREGRWYMVGIVSWGEGCGKQNKYGFYTRIANHLSWINSIIKS